MTFQALLDSLCQQKQLHYKPWLPVFRRYKRARLISGSSWGALAGW